MPNRGKLPPEDVLVASLAHCIGVWETNRGGNEPRPTESKLVTVAGIHASMATIEQATMPYAVDRLAKLPELWPSARPPLTGKELSAGRSCCKAVAKLLALVDSEFVEGIDVDRFIASHRSEIDRASLGDSDVRVMFGAVRLRETIKALHRKVAAKQVTLDKAARSIKGGDRIGLDLASLRSYIAKPARWGENRAAWQRKGVDNLPGDLGVRINAVVTSNDGMALAIPVIKTRVRDYMAKHPSADLEMVVVDVAQENNPKETDYGLNVWKTYSRLYPAGLEGRTAAPSEAALMGRASAGMISAAGADLFSAVDCLGADQSFPITKDCLAVATGALQQAPAFWGRYFKGPGNLEPTQYQPTQEADIFADSHLRILPVARQTTRVGGTQAMGYDDGLRNAAAIMAALGSVSLASNTAGVAVFLDVEPSHSLSADYFTGWSTGLVEAGREKLVDFADEIAAGKATPGTNVGFIPCIYGHHAADDTWKALSEAVRRGARCDAAWVVYMDANPSFPIGPWRAAYTSRFMPAGVRVAICQRILEWKDTRARQYDFNLVNPAFKDWIIERLVVPKRIILPS